MKYSNGTNYQICRVQFYHGTNYQSYQRRGFSQECKQVYVLPSKIKATNELTSSMVENQGRRST